MPFVIIFGICALVFFLILSSAKGKMETLRLFHRHPRFPDSPYLQHLTQEQWDAHKTAFADYQYGVGKYKNFQGCIPEWLKAEGLPVIPSETRKAVRRESAVE